MVGSVPSPSGYAAVADVHHKAHAALGRRLLREPHHFDAHAWHAGADGANLHALNERPVGSDDIHGLFKVDVFAAGGVRLVVETHPGDVEHAEDVGPGARHDM